MEECPTAFFAANEIQNAAYIWRGFVVDEADDDNYSHDDVVAGNGDDDPDDSIR